jgi:hypothetical protein
MKRILLIAIGLLFQLTALSQERKLIQLSGVVVSSDSLDQLPYATIFDKTVARGTIADYFGFFSMVVEPGDTILFNYLGHQESSFIVPDTLTDPRYSIIHMMIYDTAHTLPEFVVYPWPSREAFAKAFVEMDPMDDAIRRAQKELSGESLAFIAARVASDPALSYNYAVNQQNTRLYTMGQSPVNNLMNPFAWASFINAWRSGELGRQ